MIYFDDYGNEKTHYKLDWPYVPDWPYRILIIGGSRSGKNKCVFEFNKQLARYW